MHRLVVLHARCAQPQMAELCVLSDIDASAHIIEAHTRDQALSSKTTSKPIGPAD